MLAAMLKKVAVHLLCPVFQPFLGSVQAASLQVVSGLFVSPLLDEGDSGSCCPKKKKKAQIHAI